MARNSEFYKGRRKKRSYAIIPAAVIIGIIVLTVVLFYSMQQYAVISKDGVSVELPILKSEENTTVDSEGNVVKVFDPVDASITFDDPDYSGIEAQVGEDVPAMRAIYVSSENITQDKLNEYADRLSVGNALVLEMKPVSGNLMWNSQAQAAVNYGLYVETEQTRQIPELIAGLKAREDKDIYLVAEINVCRDALYASRSTTVCLRTELGGNYTDDEGAWLDPYNTELRQYVIDMCNELYDMGFDEVVLANVLHPTITDENTKLVYTRDMSSPPSAVNAVCGFAVSVADALQDRPGRLSIYCYSRKALVGPDTSNGQDAVLFMKLFDRVYHPTDKGTYVYNMEDITPRVTLGQAEYRFVPVVVNYLPSPSDSISWVLIDKEEPKSE